MERAEHEARRDFKKLEHRSVRTPAWRSFADAAIVRAKGNIAARVFPGGDARPSIEA